MTLGLSAQSLTIKLDDTQQEFEGAGVAVSLFLGHHFSMNTENQDKAVRLVNKDLNMQYLQDYPDERYPSDDPEYFQRRVDYFKAAMAYNPEIKIAMVGNKFPDNLRTNQVVNGNTYRVLDTDDPEIYDKLADWYFQIFQYYKNNDLEIEVFNVVNEPDLINPCTGNSCRQYEYGYDGDTERGVALIFSEAVPKFKAMLNDPSINTSGIKIPLIMGPSSFSPNGCLDYIRYFKENYPEAWDQIDIVATHQYNNGARSDLFQEILVEIGDKPFHQSETHAARNSGGIDDLGNLPVSEEVRTVLSLARIFSVAVNNGVSAWYYFMNNYPGDFEPPGLIQVAWQSTNPIPYKHYYAYKQLTTAQPAFSDVLSFEVTDFASGDIVAFKHPNVDTVYIQVANYLSVNRKVTISLDNNGVNVPMLGIKATRTDATRDDEEVLNEIYESPLSEIEFVSTPYSLSTLKIGLESTVTSVSSEKTSEPLIRLSSEGLSIESPTEIKKVAAYTLSGQLIFNAERINSRKYFDDHLMNKYTGLIVLKVQTADRQFTRKMFLKY